MGLLQARELLQFPDGDNSTDSFINGIHFNLTALHQFNYTLYSNGTISNKSKCFLIFDDYKPVMISNGTWYNGTSCYFPYYGIQTRGKLSIAFTVLFGASIFFTLMNLKKHGKRYMRENKRFRIVGRRWQWYWMSFVAACGMVSCITGVDVDRNYLQSTPIVLQSLFFSLMLPGTLAIVWESTRHWGSWEERQIYERDPFLLPADDRRGMTEFSIPLVFYLFAWLNFFMVIPRSWTRLEYQRSPEQQESEARPCGTDNRIKAGALLAICAYLVILFSLRHSLKHYKPHGKGFFGNINAFITHTPAKVFFSLIVLAIRLVYGVLSAWNWNISLFKYNVNPVWPFSLGYTPVVIILVIFEIAGFFEPNEDLVILDQKRDRDDAATQELGVTKKPGWWRGSDAHLSPEERMKKIASEVDGGGRAKKRPAAATEGFTANMELHDMNNLRNRSRTRDADDPFEDSAHPPSTNYERTERLGSTTTTATTATAEQHLRVEREGSDTTSVMSGTTARSENAPPQRIRSMLDV